MRAAVDQQFADATFRQIIPIADQADAALAVDIAPCPCEAAPGDRPVSSKAPLSRGWYSKPGQKIERLAELSTVVKTAGNAAQVRYSGPIARVSDCSCQDTRRRAQGATTPSEFRLGNGAATLPRDNRPLDLARNSRGRVMVSALHFIAAKGPSNSTLSAAPSSGNRCLDHSKSVTMPVIPLANDLTVRITRLGRKGSMRSVTRTGGSDDK